MAYLTVEDFQKYTGVFPEDDKSLQSMYLGAAENIIQNYLGYNPESTTYTDYISGNGKTMIFLNAKPITILQSISINGTEQDVSHFFFDRITECLVAESESYKFAEGNKNIKVVYTAGYSAIPDVIKLTGFRIAGILQTEDSGNIGINSKSFGDSGTRTFVNTVNFEKYLRQISKYKLV